MSVSDISYVGIEGCKSCNSTPRSMLVLGQILPVSASAPAIFHAGAGSPIIGMRRFVLARVDKTSLPPRM